MSGTPGGLTNIEVTKIVNQYIGVSGGYLGDFSYQSHADFYPEYCDLDIDPYGFEGTTRVRFMEILKSQSPADQAKILRGVLERFPVGEVAAPATRERLREDIHSWIRRLESTGPVVARVPESREVVLRALRDVETLVREQGAISGVDRIHTALHGHLRVLCESAGITTDPDATIAVLFKELRRHHPMLQDLGPRRQDIERMLNAASTMLDALGPVRNKASVAHPNDNLLAEPEAMVVINIGHTLLNYLDTKLRVAE